jgi:CubicO group peptidase (beta-lactamase class C family)
MDRNGFLTESLAAFGTVAVSARGADPRDGWRVPSTASLAEWASWADVPGASLALSSAGTIRSTAAGRRGASQSPRVNERTIFEAASLSKPVFAFACLQLVQRRQLDLDRPLGAYLPEPYPIDDPRGAAITARHVLSHTSGLPNWRFRPDQKLRLAFDPGTRFSYSGEGFFYLQRVVERITGTGVAAFLRSTVLAPSGMHDSGFVWWPDADQNLALPHDSGGQPSEPRTRDLGRQLLLAAAAGNKPLEQWTADEVIAALPELDPPQQAIPVYASPNVASSLLTTAADFARFLARSDEAASLGMYRPQVRVNTAISWGLGIGLDTHVPGGMPFHWGNNEGYKSFFVVDRKTNEAVVILTNGDRGLNVAKCAAEHSAGHRFASSLWVS